MHLHMDEIQQNITTFLHDLPNWQWQNLQMFRDLVHKVAPNVTEDWKWSVPVFVVNKRQLFAVSAFKEHTKFNFFQGASLKDTHALFNSGLDSKQHRSINLREGETIDTKKLGDLIKEAVTKAD